jgi:hypothetical protein
MTATEKRERDRLRQRRWRAARREHNVQCLICPEWFVSDASRQCHETKVH